MNLASEVHVHMRLPWSQETKDGNCEPTVLTHARKADEADRICVIGRMFDPRRVNATLFILTVRYEQTKHIQVLCILT